MPFEELSSARMVRSNLPLVWEWFDYRRGVLGECVPNAGHAALAAAQASGRFDEFHLVTQNIDGLHAAAGSTAVIELHGSVWRTRCTECGERADLRSLPAEVRPPLCSVCQAAMRPDVVLFGEYLDMNCVAKAEKWASAAAVCLVVGTSALVYPAAALPLVTRSHGGAVIEVNPEETKLSPLCDVSLRMSAGKALPYVFGAS
jgi:NAD-dependent deacetylase